MTILVLNWRCPSNPLSGGAEYVTLKHAEYWTKQGHTVHWMAGSFKGSKHSEIIRGVHILRFSKPILIPFLAPILFFLLFRSKNVLVIDQFHGLPFFTPIWLHNTKRVAFIHEVAGEIWRSEFPFPLYIIGQVMEKLILKLYRNETFWTDSISTSNELVSLGVPNNQIHVIPCSIDQQSRLRPLKKLGRIHLIFLSRLVKMKGAEEALLFTKKLYDQNKDVRLQIVGSGKKTYLLRLERLVKNLGLQKVVSFHGRVDEKTKYLQLAKSHYLLHTSMKEGFGLTVLEAFSQGTPVICFEVEGLRDLVTQNYNGFFIDNTDISDILNVDSNLYQSMCKNALQTASKYQWDTILPLSERLLENIKQ